MAPLPLILRHVEVDPVDIVVVAPDSDNDTVLETMGIGKLTVAVTTDNYCQPSSDDHAYN